MNAALEVSSYTLTDFLEWMEILRAQNFHTQGLEGEQQFRSLLLISHLP
jgi:hypothetical protein